MTCKDCYHYSCHKHWYDGFEDFDSRFNATNVEILCPEFKDKSKIIELPCNLGDTVYHYGDSFSIREIDIYNGKILFRCGNAGTDDYMVFDNEDLGETVFLNRKEDEKKLEEIINEKY